MQKYLTLLGLLLTIGLTAQQTPQTSLYNFNVYDFNPAIAGLDGNLSINGDIRRQWAGIVGAPLTQSINAQLPVYFTKGGFGLSFRNFTAGVSQNIQGAISYNQTAQISEQATISVGLSGGLSQHSFRGSELLAPGGNYELPGISHEDSQLPEFDANSVAPLLSAGIILDYNNLRLGISADNLLESVFEASEGPKDVVFNQIRHYYGYVAYEISLDNDLTLLPSFLVKAENASIQVDFNVSAELGDKFMLGMGYRGYNNISNDALIFQGGFRLNDALVLRYAYDFGLSKLKTVSSGSHELLISYDIPTDFGRGTLPQIIYNPRFL
jgi:type IX secretion system PorP/SprF family membrane protein